MAGSKQCPKCSGSMSEGYVIDHGDGGRTMVASWVEGQPERSVWTGLKLGGKARIDVATWRCARCGLLEHYASGGSAGHADADRRMRRAVLIAVIAATLCAAGAGVLVTALLR
jgi:hypothetical protein